MLENVMLVGNYRKQAATCVFTRRLDGWKLEIKLAGRERTFMLGKYDKPCWTVAAKYMDQMTPEGANQQVVKQAQRQKKVTALHARPKRPVPESPYVPAGGPFTVFRG